MVQSYKDTRKDIKLKNVKKFINFKFTGFSIYEGHLECKLYMYNPYKETNHIYLERLIAKIQQYFSFFTT